MDRRSIVAGGLGLSALLPLMRDANAQTAPRSRLATIQQNNLLKVGTTGDFNPMSFRDPQSRELRGHQIDCANRLAQDMGVRVEFVPTTWPTLINGLTAGQYDVIMTGTSMSVARLKASAFTMPWGINAFLPLARREGSERFRSWDDVNNPNTRVGFNLGTTMEQFVTSQLPRATVRRVESPVRDFQELIAGRVDVTITSLVEGSQLVQEYPQLTMVLQNQPRNSIPLCFMSAIDDVIWTNFLNSWIVLHQTGGFLAELSQRWNLVLHRT